MIDHQYIHPHSRELITYLNDQVRHIQILAGPRQTGKTSAAIYAAHHAQHEYVYLNADEYLTSDLATSMDQVRWLAEHWRRCRQKIEHTQKPLIIVVDEVHKIHEWATVIKGLWDRDRINSTPLHVVLLGSSLLAIRAGIATQLTGRCRVVAMHHWSYAQMKQAFGLSLTEFLYYGGYPGAVHFFQNNSKWKSYIKKSIIWHYLHDDLEFSLPKTHRALLHNTFEIGVAHSGDILSHKKMLGKLTAKGSLHALADCLRLLDEGMIVATLSCYAKHAARSSASHDKLNVYNTALMSAHSSLDITTAQNHEDFWPHLVESAVGAHLLNAQEDHDSLKLFYWRDQKKQEQAYEVDFVLQSYDALVGFEVKSGKKRSDHSKGLRAFREKFKQAKIYLIGEGGISLEEFLLTPPETWMKQEMTSHVVKTS